MKDGLIMGLVPTEITARAALDMISRNYFSSYEPGIFAPLRDALSAGGDHCMHLADRQSYVETDHRLTVSHADKHGAARKAMLNVACSGKFSSDRTIHQYASEIWNAYTPSGAVRRSSQ